MARIALALAALLTLVLPALFESHPSNWNWGLHAWHFLPAAWAWSLRALAAAVLAWAVFTRPDAAAPTAKKPRKGKAAGETGFFSTSGLWLRLAAGAAIAALLWVGRERIHFLGDTALRLDAVLRLSRGEPGGEAWALHAAPLDFLLLVKLPALLAGSGSMTPLAATQFIPCLLGGLFALAAFEFARACADTGAGRWIAAAVLLTQGYLEVFAGYSESYGLQSLLLLAWAAAALREHKRGAAPGASAVFAALALLSHRTSVLILPAQAWLYFTRPGRKFTGASAAGAVAILAAFAWLCASSTRVLKEDLAAITHTGRHVPGPGDYGLFSAIHAANVFNDLFLLAPVLLAAIALWLFLRPRPEGSGVLLAAAAPFLALALLVRNLYPGQGAVRDWDTFAPAGLLIAVLAAAAAARFAESGRRAARLAGAACAACAVNAAGWIALNATPAAAVARVQLVAKSEPALPISSRAMVYEFLGQLWQAQTRPRQAAAAYMEAAALAPNARFFMLAGLQLWDAGERKEAESVFRQGAARDPAFRERIMRLTEIGLRQNPADSLSLLMRRVMLEAAATPHDSVP